MAKRTNGEGSIRKRNDGRWEGRYFDVGLQKQRSVYGKTQKEVREKLKEKSNDKEDGIDWIKGAMLVEQWLTIWINTYNINIKPLTYDSYTAIIKNHINPAIGNIKLQNLCTQDIQNMYNNMIDVDCGKGLSVKTLRNVHGVVHKAMNQAMNLGYIKRNPADACVIPKHNKKEIIPMDSELVKAFVKLIKEDAFADVFFVTLFTGVRQGEILGLKWDCVDFDRGVITIKRQLQKRKQKGSSYFLTTTKSGKDRYIMPAPIVMDVLHKVKEKQDEKRMSAGSLWNTDPKWNGLVFTNELGKHLVPCTVYKHYKAIVKKMEEDYLRFHDLRHSFAVISLENGDDIKTVQETLGHYSAAFTMDTYSHVTKLMQIRSAERMQNYIANI